ncbi:MAG: dihydroorotase, partial [Bacteroidota bacterium]
QDEESKKMEFDLADYGMIGIQAFYPLINRLSKEIPMELLLKCITENPRKLLGMKQAKIAVGHAANMTIFDENKEWNYDLSSNTSRSENSPFLGESMKGKIVGIVNGEKSTFNL